MKNRSVAYKARADIYNTIEHAGQSLNQTTLATIDPVTTISVLPPGPTNYHSSLSPRREGPSFMSIPVRQNSSVFSSNLGNIHFDEERIRL